MAIRAGGLIFGLVESWKSICRDWGRSRSTGNPGWGWGEVGKKCSHPSGAGKAYL